MSRLTSKEMKLAPIFPRTIGVIEGIRITQEDIDILMGAELHRNMSNSITKNTYLLNNPALHELRETIEECLFQYIDNTIKPMNYTKFTLTQSWVNVAEKGEAHHFHSHPNSLISGCLYLSADRAIDQIVFFRDLTPVIHIQSREQTIFNSDKWMVPVHTGDLIFFPSCLPHSVPPNEREEKRISLAFNVFAEGILGAKDGSTELKLDLIGEKHEQQ
jgi:uncharacterized protein (TIGR02466 family)